MEKITDNFRLMRDDIKSSRCWTVLALISLLVSLIEVEGPLLQSICKDPQLQVGYPHHTG